MPRTEKTKSNGKDKNAYRYQKKGNGKNDTGRPLIEATEQDCVIAETMAKLGGTNEEICATLDISIDTMKAWELRDKEFSVAINSGRDYHSNMGSSAVSGIAQRDITGRRTAPKQSNWNARRSTNSAR